jgi:hypothetical protein
VSDPSILGAIEGTGWMAIESTLDVFAFDLYGDVISGGIAALPSSTAATQLVLPHFHVSDRWWTGVSIVNPNPLPVSVKLTGFTETGIEIAQVSQAIPARGKIVGYVQDLLKFTGDQTGWLLIESTGGDAAGLLIFGDKIAVPNAIAALSATQASTGFLFSDFRNDPQWWTGITVVNPDPVLSSQVKLLAYSSAGGTPNRRSFTILPRQKLSGLVSEIFSLHAAEGWIDVSSDGPVVGLELLNGNAPEEMAWGLAGVEPQMAASEIAFAHYAYGPRWWTRLAFLNPNSLSTQSATLAFGNDGSYAGRCDLQILPQVLIATDLRDLLGVKKD